MIWEKIKTNKLFVEVFKVRLKRVDFRKDPRLSLMLVLMTDSSCPMITRSTKLGVATFIFSADGYNGSEKSQFHL